MINFKKNLKSLKFAIEGLFTMLREENNARFHLLATVCVVGLGIYMNLSKTDWLWISLAIAIVWILEAINTALEALVNLASPEIHPLAKKAKDVAAAAVLFGAIWAVVVGVIVFWGYIV